MANIELQENFVPEKYMGLWYEIAKYPQPFEFGCDGPITAEYSLNCNGTINVDNRCYDQCGKCKYRAIGVAQSWNSQYPAALRVDFPGYGYEQFETYKGPNYLIHNTNYWYSIVGSPDKKGLYILSRNPKISLSLFKVLVVYIEYLGYDSEKLVLNSICD